MMLMVIRKSIRCVFLRIAAVVSLVIAHGAVFAQAPSGYFDRLGRPVATALPAKTSGNFTLAADPIIITTGAFEARFVPDTSHSDRGFFDDDLGARRRAVIQEVLTDLSRLLIRPQDAAPVRINVRSFHDPASATGARASSVYKGFPAAVSGIVDGAVWSAVVAGVDPYIGFSDAPDYHGFIEVNFAQTYNLDIDASEFTGADLYSGVLHEMLHALGVGSFIAADGTSVVSGRTPGYYSRFDTFLHAATLNDTIPLVAREGNCYATRYNPALGPQDVARDCAAGDGSIIFRSPDVVAPMYAPQRFEPGASLSHLDQRCAPGVDYVMHPSIAPGTAKRTPHPDEIAILCALGYRTSGAYGSPESPARYREYAPCDISPVAGANDTLAAIAIGAQARITLADLIANDRNAERALCIEVIGGAHAATLSRGELLNAGDTLVITPDLHINSDVIIRYLPSNGAQTGNMTYAFLPVTLPPVPDCAPDPCNFICNGGFEVATRTGQITACPTCCGSSAFVQSWWSTSSDIYRRSIDSALQRIPGATFPWYKLPWLAHAPDTWDRDNFNAHYAGFATRRHTEFDIESGEELFQELSAPLVADGTQYILEFYIYPVMSYHSVFLPNEDRDSIAANLVFSTQIFLSPDNPCTSGQIAFPMRPEYQLIKTDRHPTNTWTKVTAGPFEVQDTMSWITFRGDASFQTDSVDVYAFIDDIVIRKAGVGITSRVSDQYPQPGAEITYTFEVCSDIPDRQTGVTVIDALPDGLEYAGGDFTPVAGELLAAVDPAAFDTAGCVTLTLHARVADDARLLGVPLTNRIYPAGADACRSGPGKTELTIVPTPPHTRIERTVTAPICRNDEFTVTLRVCNLTFAPQDALTITETLDPGLEFVERSVVINGAPDPQLGTTYGRYVRLGNTLNFTPLCAQAATPTAGDGSNCVDISYRARAVASAATLSLYARAQHGASGPAATDAAILPVVPETPSVYLGPDTAICGGPWTLDAGPGGDIRYRWSTGDTTRTIEAGVTNDYWVEVENAAGCLARDTVTVRLEPNPVVRLTPPAIYAEPGEYVNFMLQIDTTGFNGRTRTFLCTLRFDYRLLCDKPRGCSFFEGNDCMLIREFVVNGDEPVEEALGVELWVADAIHDTAAVSIEDCRWLDCGGPVEVVGAEVHIGNSLEHTERLPQVDHGFALAPNHPNPFRDRTRIEFELRHAGFARLAVYDVTGRLVTTLIASDAAMGRYAVDWVTGDASSGVYLLTLTNDPHTENFGPRTATQVMVLLR